MELTLIDYDMVHHRPSEIAAAALCLSQKILGHNKWVTILIKLVLHSMELKQLKSTLKIVFTLVTMLVLGWWLDSLMHSGR